jgi:hypothetical protein
MDGTRSHAEGVHIRLQIYLLYCSEGVTQYPTVLGYMNMILLPGQRTGREWQRESTNNERTGRRFFTNADLCLHVSLSTHDKYIAWWNLLRQTISEKEFDFSKALADNWKLILSRLFARDCLYWMNRSYGSRF